MPDEQPPDAEAQVQELSSHVEEYDLPTKYEAVPVEDLRKYQLQHACTEDKDGEFRFPNVWKTPPKDIGRITKSVGCQLYFELMHGIGWTFLVMFLLSVPLLVCCLHGDMVTSSSELNKAISSTTIANLGRCPAEGCQSVDDYRDRCIWDGDCDANGATVKEWAPWLGLLDALALLAFMLFGIIFRTVRIPQVVKQFDKDSLTPADFTLEIPNPPRNLGDNHHGYQESLKTHFVNVLKNLAENPVENADESSIAAVSLVREYNGATAKFLDKGIYIETLRNAYLRKLKARGSSELDEAKKAKVIAVEDKKIKKLKERIHKISTSLKNEAQKMEHERAVCRAFITFKTAEYKEKVEWEYRFSKFRLLRLFQNPALRFAGKRIKVQQAPEPSDLYWENLDFDPYQKMARQCVICIITIVVLCATSFGLVAAQSYFGSIKSELPQYDTYVLQPVPEVSNGNTVRTNVCTRLQTMDYLEKCVSVSASSADWEHAEIFDAQGVLSKSTTGSKQTGSDFWDNDDWISPGCNESANLTDKDNQWLGVTFSIPRQVSCMNVQMTGGDFATRIRPWACLSSDIPEADKRYNWTPSKGCHAMLVVEAKQGTSKYLAVQRDTECSLQVTLEVAEEAKERDYQQQVDCFCQQELLRNPKITAPPYDTREKKVCEEWSLRQIKIYGAMAFSVIAVILINQILLLIFSLFISFMRPFTVTEKTAYELCLLFFTQFMNTALLIYLVNARMPSIPDAFKIITEPLSIGRGEYYEVTAVWYVVIGASLVITILTQVFSNTLPQLLTSCVIAPIIRKISMWSSGAVSRKSLEQIWTLPEWNLALRAAQSFNVICTIVFYSGGMPVLYFAGAFYAFVAYWFDKFGLLKGSKRPPAYNALVIQICMNFIPMSAICHALFASFIFGNQDLFPSEWNPITLPFAEFLFGVSVDDQEQVVEEWAVASIADRDKPELFKAYSQARWLDFARWGASPTMVIFIVGFAYYALYYLWHFFLKPLLLPCALSVQDFCRKRCCSCCGGKKDTHTHSEDWQQAVETFKSRGMLCSYTMQDHPQYSDAAVAVAHTAKKEIERRGTAASAPSPDTTGASSAGSSPLKAATAPAAVGSPSPVSPPEPKV